jgi:hypothetical protein
VFISILIILKLRIADTMPVNISTTTGVTSHINQLTPDIDPTAIISNTSFIIRLAKG